MDATKLKSFLTGWREHILELYILSLSLIFPFYATDKCFAVLKDRAEYYIFTTFILAALFLAGNAAELLHDVIKLKKGDTDSLSESFKMTCSRKSIPAEVLFLSFFLVICAISTWFSEWRLDAFTGEDGRYHGLLIWIFYVISFLLIKKHYKPRKRDYLLFLLGGAMVSLWGLLNYMGYDPFGWMREIKKDQRSTFTSSIGNINTYTAMMGLYFGASGMSLLNDKDHYLTKVFYTIVFFMTGVSMITGTSDNSALGMLAFYGLLPFYVWKNKKTVRNFIWIIITGISAFPASYMMVEKTSNPYVVKNGSILLKLCRTELMPYYIGLILILLLFMAVLSWPKKREEIKIPEKKMITMWMVILAAAVAGVLMILYDANFGNNPERYKAYSRFLVFNDSWGTSRGFCWRIGYETFKDMPVIKKLVGSGPDTFGLAMKKEHYDEMVKVAKQFFDSPHNEVFQHVFCTGILGALSYYLFLATSYFKGMKENGFARASAMGVAVYTAISVVNISVPITQPVLMLLASWCVLDKKYREKEQEVHDADTMPVEMELNTDMDDALKQNNEITNIDTNIESES